MTQMTPFDWAKRPLQKYADFTGRAPRAEFWWYCLLMVVAAIVGMILDSIVGLGAVFHMYGPLTLLVLLATFVPTLAVQVRRLHDTNKSGFWLLAFYLPYLAMLAMMPSFGDPAVGVAPDLGSAAIVGILSLIVLAIGITLLVFYLFAGTKGANRYGPDPYSGDGEAVAAA